MTGGDAWAYTMIVLVTCLSLWAGITGVGLLSPPRCAAAEQRLSARPGWCIATGATIGVLGIALGLTMMNANPAPLKIMGIALILFLVLVAFPGAAGLARIAARRLRGDETADLTFASTGRASAMLILASLAPFIGWFLVFPLQFFASLGAGLGVLRRTATEPAP